MEQILSVLKPMQPPFGNFSDWTEEGFHFTQSHEQKYEVTKQKSTYQYNTESWISELYELMNVLGLSFHFHTIRATWRIRTPHLLACVCCCQLWLTPKQRK